MWKSITLKILPRQVPCLGKMGLRGIKDPLALPNKSNPCFWRSGCTSQGTNIWYFFRYEFINWLLVPVFDLIDDYVIFPQMILPLIYLNVVFLALQFFPGFHDSNPMDVSILDVCRHNTFSNIRGWSGKKPYLQPPCKTNSRSCSPQWETKGRTCLRSLKAKSLSCVLNFSSGPLLNSTPPFGPDFNTWPPCFKWFIGSYCT